MAKMNNAMMVSALNVLNKIKKEDRHLPVKLMYALNRNIKELYDNFYTPYEETLNGIDKENDREALAQLLDTEINPSFYKVSLEDLEGADLSINEMEVIQTFFLKEENE